MNTPMLLNDTLRAAILNVADAVAEYNETLGYKIRETVSGRTVDHKVECDRDTVRAALRDAITTMDARVGNMAWIAAADLEHAYFMELPLKERLSMGLRLHADAWAEIR